MSLYTNLTRAITDALAFPQLMCIDIVRISKETGGYNADGEIVVPSTFERTGEIIKNAPICIPGATQSGAGIFATADKDQLAIVQYLGGNKSHPIITGYYTDEYQGACDDEAAISIHAGKGKLNIASESDDVSIKSGTGKLNITSDADMSINSGKGNLSIKSSSSSISIDSITGKVSIKNQTENLGSILNSVLSILSQLKTMGGPTNQNISPDTIVLLKIEQNKLKSLLE